MVDPRPLNRAQLARIAGNDPDAIRTLERLFQVAGQLTPDQIQELQISIDGVSAQAMVAANAAGRVANNARLDYVDFGAGPGVDADRRAKWGDGTLAIGLDGGDTLQVGQDVLMLNGGGQQKVTAESLQVLTWLEV